MKLRNLFAFAFCFSIGLAIYAFSHQSEPLTFNQMCLNQTLSKQDTFGAVTVRASDLAFSGDGTEANPYILDADLLNMRTDMLATSSFRIVVDGECNSYLTEKTIHIPSKTVFTRFDLHYQGTASALSLKGAENSMIKQNNFFIGENAISAISAYQ